MKWRAFAVWVAFWVLIAPLLLPYDPMATALASPFAAPSELHGLGTDYLGRDTLSRLLAGGQRALLMGLASAGLALGLGAGLGGVSRLHPVADRVVNPLVDALMSLPPLVLALLVLLLAGGAPWAQVAAVGLAQAGPYARLVRDALMQAAVGEGVLAAEAMGASRGHILRRHLWPYAWPMLRAYAGVTLVYCLLNASALSFLGFAPPGVPDWGAMLAEGRNGFSLSAWPALAPAASLFITVLLLNRAVHPQP